MLDASASVVAAAWQVLRAILSTFTPLSTGRHGPSVDAPANSCSPWKTSTRQPFTAALLVGVVLSACGDSPTSPGGPPPPPPPPASLHQVSTLLTVYRSAGELAQWTRGTEGDDRIGRILLGVEDLGEGTTILNNEGGRFELQASIERINAEFNDADYRSAFDETRETLTRFFNDADNDGWAIDGRHGAGRDWPHDEDGNDPDGWAAQMIITVTLR